MRKSGIQSYNRKGSGISPIKQNSLKATAATSPTTRYQRQV